MANVFVNSKLILSVNELPFITQFQILMLVWPSNHFVIEAVHLPPIVLFTRAQCEILSRICIIKPPMHTDLSITLVSVSLCSSQKQRQQQQHQHQQVRPEHQTSWHRATLAS